MRTRREGCLPESDTFAWSITFSDLMMLLLTFFVLRLAMSEPGQEPRATAPLPSPAVQEIQELPTAPLLATVQEGEALRVSLPGIFTASDSSEISFHGRERLITFGHIAAVRRLYLSVSAQVDAKSGLISSWDLAADRAQAAVSQFIDSGVLPSAIEARTVVEKSPVSGVQQNMDLSNFDGIEVLLSLAGG